MPIIRVFKGAPAWGCVWLGKHDGLTLGLGEEAVARNKVADGMGVTM